MTKYRFEPFDVKRAMAGEVVVVGDHESSPVVKFAGYNPEADMYSQVIVWNENGMPNSYDKNGETRLPILENTLHIRVEIKERENADIIRAYADGNSIEWRRKSDDNSLPWYDFEIDDSPPIGHIGYDWRIKP